ncbi:flagellar biosynthesis protein FlhB [Novispirillum sp. DQ9]|uniref:flagellar biosynthesis protein FlhB n=1 Tax=Novispirillum sp. DQ9 TaxID=3398612 RepID=UPI003C7C32D5
MSEDDDKESKTEDPTEKRRSKAREEGDVANSDEVKSLVALVAGLVIVAVISPWMIAGLRDLLAVYLGKAHTYPTDAEGIRQTFISLLEDVGAIMLVPLALTVVAAVLATTGQVGLLYTPKKLAPKFGAINPIKGVSRVISKQKIVDFFKQIIKIIIVGAVVGLIIVPMIPHPDVLMGKSIHTTLDDLHWLLTVTLVAVIIAYIAVAFLDMMWTRFQHTSKLKMTKQEVKDEGKQSEGDPTVKGRIRSLRMQRARQRMMAAVPQASVVVTNPTHFAVALQYNMDSMAAPKLVAKGVDFVAARIREVAKEHDIPIVENPPLARALHAAVDLDEEIPQEHYKAVAEVIGYVMRLKGGAKKTR